jgi:hypothetical protein
MEFILNAKRGSMVSLKGDEEEEEEEDQEHL